MISTILDVTLLYYNIYLKHLHDILIFIYTYTIIELIAHKYKIIQHQHEQSHHQDRQRQHHHHHHTFYNIRFMFFQSFFSRDNNIKE
jgi:hypothetical protein